MIERTFAIIKPDAVSAKNCGKIIEMIEKNGFEILRMRKIHLDKSKAEEFYSIHKEKPFFDSLINFMISGPIIVMALEKENALADWRKLMGPLDYQNAEEGTIRKHFGTDIEKNAVHGSDAPETAKFELGLFFPNL